MASVSSQLREVNLQDKTSNTPQNCRGETHSKNKKTLEDGKLLRKKIRHLRREDEKQARSLTQDLKDIRKSLSDVNNLNQIRRETVYSNNSTKTKRGQEKDHKVKSKGKSEDFESKTTSNECDNSEETLSDINKEPSLPSKQQKTVRFEDDKNAASLSEKDKSENRRKDNKTVLSLSGIHLK